ncbi:hypothetical protein SAMN05720472_2054 [Fibrobacter sp. UWR3]|jgi:hypothetical protein|uniref:DUF6169 family protein n=1 Tax=Fibrobacter sp. UWR3 TaxID=1896217 RepID=UPI00091AC96D|nr:DUF6169 family protein [Fibrobacter sp. UWR3]SHM70862.1 hypothetical protein SAMN05720472_2054 [Fibrobacter sp. UWR3]
MTTLDLSSRYSLEETDSGYRFTTDYGNEYIVTFSDLGSILGATELKLYEFGLDIAKRNNANNDKVCGKMRNTVVDILSRVFSNQPEAAILLSLDSVDGRQRGRYRMFLSAEHNSWFKLCNNGKLTIVPLSIQFEGFSNISFLLVRSDNPHLNEILQYATEYVSLSFEG